MKQAILSITLLLITTLHIRAQAASEPKILNEGTVITVELQQDLNSKKNSAGEMVNFLVSEAVIVGDRVYVNKGTEAIGIITECVKAKGMGKGGLLNFDIKYLKLPSGKNVKLTNEVKSEGKNRSGGTIAAAAIINPLFLLRKGKNIEYKKGQQFQVFVEADTQL